jgi:poly-gamma-glutamate synthesis protein (capsule biosynthesis protein)
MKLAALGDLFFGDQLACLGFGVRSYGDVHGYDGLFDDVRTKLTSYDFVVANLETVLSQAKGQEKNSLHQVLNRGSPLAAEAIKRGGVHLLSLANNHIFDYGPAGLNDTIDALETAGLEHCGTKRKSTHLAEHEGRKHAFLSWSLVPDSHDARAYYNVTADPEEIIAEIRRARAQADNIILSLHAGNEFIAQPSTEFADTCHRFVDAGANIVLGHHPHVLQPIERYSRGLIAYSLGNFIICSWDSDSRFGMILGIAIDDAVQHETSFFEICKNNYTPSSIRDRRRIETLRERVSTLQPLPTDAYLAEVKRLRTGYRLSTLWHVLKNLYRTKWRLALLRLALRRVRYLWSIRKAERDRPELVYMAPETHVGRSRD